MSYTETFGERVRRLRMARGLSLRQLAKVVGVSAPFLSDLEHDRRNTSRLEELAKALGVSVSTLEESAPVSREDVEFLNKNPKLLALLRARKRKS